MLSFLRSKTFYLLIGLVPVIVAVALFFSVSHSPYLGMDFERKGDKWYLVSVDNTLHAGKYDNLIGAEVVEIAGKHIEADTLEHEINARKNKNDTKGIFSDIKYFSEHIKTGQVITISLINKGGISNIDVVPAYYPKGKYLLDNMALLVTGFITLLVGLFLIFKRHDNRHAQMMFVVSFFLSLECFSMPILYIKSSGYDFMQFMMFFNIMQVSVYYFLSSIAYFVLAFPDRHPLLNNKFVILFIWLVPFSYLYFFYVNMVFPFFIGYIVLMCLSPIIIAAYKYFTITSPDMRAQMKTIMLGIIIGFIIALVLFFLPVILVGKSIVAANWILCTAIVFPLFTAFAIMRYKLMDIDTIFDNTIIYTLTILILASLDLFIIYFLTDTVLSGLDIPQPFVVIFAVWIIIFAYIPVRNFVQDIIKKFLRRELYDIDQVALSLSQQMLSAGDMRAVYEKATNTITNTLHPKGIEYTFIGEKGGGLMELKHFAVPVDVSSYTKPVPLFEIESSDKKLPDNYSGGALVPVVGTKGHMGYFVLQDKHSQRLYDSEDMKLLSVIASQLALTLEAIQYKEELRKKEEDVYKEKEMLMKNIHDGIGGTLANMSIMAYMGGKQEASPEVKRIFESLSDLSKETLFEINKLFAIIESKDIEWATLFSAMRHFGSTMLEPHHIEFDFSCNIRDGAPKYINNNHVFSIHKIYKEAISNIVKYSQATQVGVVLEVTDKQLTLSIKDNGIGLQGEKTASLEGGRGLRNMQDRAAEIGAALEITSENGVLIYFEKAW